MSGSRAASATSLLGTKIDLNPFEVMADGYQFTSIILGLYCSASARWRLDELAAGQVSDGALLKLPLAHGKTHQGARGFI